MRDELLRQYEVNRKGVILTPGKFAGQMLYVPHFWDRYLSGSADDTTAGFITCFITEEEKKEFPELRQAETITLIEIGRTIICELPIRSAHRESKGDLRHSQFGFLKLFRKESALAKDVSAESGAR